jgi:hypothetical protein
MKCPECLCDMIQDLFGDWFCDECEEEDDA